MSELIAALAEAAPLAESAILTFMLVFARVSATAALLPGFGSQMIPARIKLGVGLSFAAIVAPLVDVGTLPRDLASLATAIGIEIVAGLVLGLSIRLLVMALQFAGAIAAQATSIAQIMGPGAMPDPLPALGALLTLAGITLALTLGLHLRAAEAMVLSYDLIPPGRLPAAADVATWGTARVAETFALGLTLAAPFVLAALAYNIALGAINRAMPQLMVAFVGAPAITGGALLLLLVGGPLIITTWADAMAQLLADPLAIRP
ncbi:flagellar biosynthetic protein FliR [Pontivivens ytuae]|nr:flagellar biosynthetic protein FliR [Pontivivens ytuae]